MHTHTLPDTRTGEMSFGGNLLIHGFVISYIMIMAYVLLNIVIAILLQNFWECQHEQERFELLKTAMDALGRRPLDALLNELVVLPFSASERNRQVALMFQAFDVNRSGRLNYFETAHGFRSLNFDPRIHFSFDDFVQLTRDCEMHDADGTLMRISAHQVPHLDFVITGIVAHEIIVCVYVCVYVCV